MTTLDNVVKTFSVTEFGDIGKVRLEIRKLEKKAKNKAEIAITGTFPGGKRVTEEGKKKVYEEPVNLEAVTPIEFKTNWALVPFGEDEQMWVRLDKSNDLEVQATVPSFTETEDSTEADVEDASVDGEEDLDDAEIETVGAAEPAAW